MGQDLLVPIVFVAQRQELALVLGPLATQLAPIMEELVRLIVLEQRQQAFVILEPTLEVEPELRQEVVLVGLSFIRIGW